MARWYGEDVGEERTFLVGEGLKRAVDSVCVPTLCDTGCEQRLRLGREVEDTLRLMVTKRLQTGTITGCEERLLILVPDRE